MAIESVAIALLRPRSGSGEDSGRTDPIRKASLVAADTGPFSVMQTPVKFGPSQACHSPKPCTMTLPLCCGQET